MVKSVSVKPTPRDSETTENVSVSDTQSVSETDDAVVVVGPDTENELDTDLKKRELIDLVVTQSGVKKKFAKPAIESLLAVLGQAVSEGRELNLQPFGKLKIDKVEDKPNARVIKCKLRQSKPDSVPEDGSLDTAAE